MITKLLQKPLAVFDIESTGLNKKIDRIIDLAVVLLQPDGSRITRIWRVNPGQPIPPGATTVHGITDDDVRDAPPFAEVAKEVAELLTDHDLGGFNILYYDIPLLQEEFQRVGMTFSIEGRRIVDMQRIFHIKEPRTLSAALKFYCDTEHTDAHSALSDVEASIQVLNGQLERYPDLPATMDGLDQLCNPKDPDWADVEGKLKWSGKELIINFGQKQGMRLHDLVKSEPSYLRWILDKDFHEDTKRIVRDALDGRLPQRPNAASPTE